MTLDFLYNWPKSKRGPIYAAALMACQRAFELDYPLSGAREAFASFAKLSNILEGGAIPMPWIIASKRGHGGMPV